MNERIQWITHKGKRILLVDQSNIRDEAQAIKLIDEVEVEILQQPKGQKVLTIFNSPNSLVTSAVTEHSKKMVANINAQGIPTGPSVIVGSAGFQKAVVQMLQFFMKDIHLADSIEEAKDWLVAQKIE
ncbi:MAG: hypothetical protein JW726_20490 [Anaerolineales bacterium]|nr:hypothetical protein [Anaerolineales bacterium]